MHQMKSLGCRYNFTTSPCVNYLVVMIKTDSRKRKRKKNDCTFSSKKVTAVRITKVLSVLQKAPIRNKFYQELTLEFYLEM